MKAVLEKTNDISTGFVFILAGELCYSFKKKFNAFV